MALHEEHPLIGPKLRIILNKMSKDAREHLLEDLADRSISSERLSFAMLVTMGETVSSSSIKKLRRDLEMYERAQDL